MLSLGLEDYPLEVGKRVRERGGKLLWAGPGLELLMRGQSLLASNQAELILSKEQFVRICPAVSKGKYALDKVSEELEGLAASEARKAVHTVSKLFLDRETTPFEPVYRVDDVDGIPRLSIRQ